MRLDKRFKAPKILRGRILIVPEKAPVAYSDNFIPPGRYFVLSTHLFGITVSSEKGTEIYGVEWQFTVGWEVADEAD